MKEVICLKCLPNSGRQNQFRMRSLFRPNLLKTGLFICIAVLSVTGMTWAQAGQLDTTFAIKGIFLLNPIGQQGSCRQGKKCDPRVSWPGFTVADQFCSGLTEKQWCTDGHCQGTGASQRDESGTVLPRRTQLPGSGQLDEGKTLLYQDISC